MDNEQVTPVEACTGAASTRTQSMGEPEEKHVKIKSIRETRTGDILVELS